MAVVAAQGARVHTTCRLISKPKVRSATRCQQQLSSHRVQLNSTQPFGKHISSIRLTRHQPKRSHPQASLQEAVAVLTETPVRDVAAVIASIVGARLLIVVCELLEEQNVIDQVSFFSSPRCIFLSPACLSSLATLPRFSNRIVLTSYRY